MKNRGPSPKENCFFGFGSQSVLFQHLCVRECQEIKVLLVSHLSLEK